VFFRRRSSDFLRKNALENLSVPPYIAPAMTRSAQKKPLRTILLILLLIILLPALLYTVYELSTRGASEELVTDIYRRQLDVVLFSLNQYSWDVASGWASSLSLVLREGGGTDEILDAARRTGVLRGVVLADTALRSVRWLPLQPGASGEGLHEALLGNREKIAQLPGLRRTGYRKLESVLLPDNTIELVFATGDDTGEHALVGMVLGDSLFVQEILEPRIREAAGEEFVLVVTRAGSDGPLFVAGNWAGEEIRQQKQLWLFPDLSLGIRLAGQSLDEVVGSRFQRNLLLILLVDLVLIAAALFVYRAFRRELELTRMKSDFVATVSHELRTPLSLIRMYAETLEMGRLKAPQKRKEYLATIVRETERLSHLINNILNFARIDAGRKVYHFGDVQVNDVVNSVVDTYEAHLREQGFQVVVELFEGLPPVSADAEALKEGIVNLLDNAVKYSVDRKYLRISTGSEGGRVFVDVEDRGVGIAPRHREKIFEMFYRVSEGDVQTTKGSGLGLALVRHIMDAHHGSVTVTSTPGAGSTFRLSFPVKGSALSPAVKGPSIDKSVAAAAQKGTRGPHHE
jgi:two-component system phosphate regulon sensor histidine kinase PhoR